MVSTLARTGRMHAAPYRALAMLALCLLVAVPAVANPSYWKREWPQTDFTKHAIEFDEILSGGPPRTASRRSTRRRSWRSRRSRI